jgi:DNA polymerase-4
MDAFYVSVELRRRPELRGKPVVVGGTGTRGVIAAASYEARRYGVFSAMPSGRARRLCPDAVFLPGDHELYGQVSAEVHEIFQTVTPFIEPLALDEAFLDVTGAQKLLGDPVSIAHHIRDEVWRRLELQCSVGVAANKFLAKLASKGAKPVAGPDGVRPGLGVLDIPVDGELAFLHPLPVKALWGVGPATLLRLDNLGVHTVRDLAELDETSLVSALGSAHGRLLHQLAWGLDDRPVEVDRAPKSIGHEETFDRDLHTLDQLRHELVRLSDGVASRLRANDTGARTLTLKVRFAGFHTITRATTVPSPLHTAHAILQAVDPLLDAIDPSPGVRLVGVSASNFGEPAEQLSLDVDSGELATEVYDWEAAETTIDAIRSRFGASAIGPASAVTARGLRVVRKGAQQWGPDQQSPPT